MPLLSDRPVKILARGTFQLPPHWDPFCFPSQLVVLGSRILVPVVALSIATKGDLIKQAVFSATNEQAISLVDKMLAREGKRGIATLNAPGWWVYMPWCAKFTPHGSALLAPIPIVLHAS